jgi:PII-like signaling protein
MTPIRSPAVCGRIRVIAAGVRRAGRHGPEVAGEPTATGYAAIDREDRMRLHGPALRLTVFLGETDQYHHRPLYTEIVHRAHAAGLAGATVVRGIEGYGASTHIHTTRILTLTEDLPLVIVIVDDAERIRGFLPQLDEIVAEGLVMLDEVEVVKYVGRRHQGGGNLHPGEQEPT